MNTTRQRHPAGARSRTPAPAALAAATLALVLLLAAWPGPAPAQYAAPPAAAAGTPGEQPQFQGQIDVNELRRLIDLARESGFTDEQVREITVEDENGNVINAWQFLQDYERRQRELAERAKVQQAKVYLSPKDILKELDGKQSKDLDTLRDKLIFVD